VIVLDTTVLVYAKGADHPLRDPCRELIAAIGSGDIEATTSVEAIQEFVHVRARRRDREDAAALGGDYADLLSPLLEVDRESLRSGLGLFERIESLGAFDAVLAAGAMAAGAAALVSADVGFSEVPGLVHVVPNAAGVAGQLKG
jgi:predicted nucleic acid-binding protein